VQWHAQLGIGVAGAGDEHHGLTGACGIRQHPRHRFVTRDLHAGHRAQLRSRQQSAVAVPNGLLLGLQHSRRHCTVEARIGHGFAQTGSRQVGTQNGHASANRNHYRRSIRGPRPRFVIPVERCLHLRFGRVVRKCGR